jgi:two-component system response regulator AtoC
MLTELTDEVTAPEEAESVTGEIVRIPLGTTLREAERVLILRTLEAQDGNKKSTAAILGISRRSLYNKLAAYGVEPQRRRAL